MMQMLAWVSLLQDDGLVNRLLGLRWAVPTSGCTGSPGRPVVVVLGLVYGYVAYMILPLRRSGPAAAVDARATRSRPTSSRRSGG